MKGKRSENGQALVLIILSVVALFGFAALAVDFGRIYSERRRAQSAADSAALAAAYSAAASESEDANERYNVALDKALASAAKNGFDGVTRNSVIVNSPPDHGTYEECRCEYIQVIISTEVDPIFVQLLGRGVSQISAEAVARGRRTSSISSGNAVHALIENGEGGDGVEVDGNIDFTVKNGNIYSNKNGVKRGGSGNVAVIGGEIITADGWTNTNGISATGGFRSQDPLRIPNPPEPDCNLPAGTHDSTTYNPGRYDSGISVNGGIVTMKPGMYCVKNGIQIRGNGTVKGDGIFIVLLSGEIRINGNSKVQWKRPNDLTDGSGNQWGGMLIYAPPSNTNEIYLTGTNGTKFTGTVFAPKSMCEYGGTNMTTGSSAQLICHQVRLHGNPDITIDYHEEEDYRMPPIVELIE